MSRVQFLNSDARLLFISRLVGFVFVCSMPFLLHALTHSRMGAAQVYKWLPEQNADRQAYTEFVDCFGDDQVMMVSWDGLKRDDPIGKAFVAQLRESSSDGKPSLIRKVESTDEILAKLQEPPYSLSERILRSRFKGSLFGESDSSAIWISFEDRAVEEPATAIEKLRAVANSIDGLGFDQLKLVGPLYESYCIDLSVHEALLRFVPISSIIALGVAWILLRSVVDTILALTLAGIGQLISVSVVYFAGDVFSAIQTMLPTLVFVLTLSGVIHLLKYARHAPDYAGAIAGVQAIRIGTRPCFWATATTVVAMLTLSTSELAPIRLFGLYSAISLAISTLLSLALFPACYDLLSKLPILGRGSSVYSTAHPSPRWGVPFVRFMASKRSFVLLASFALIVIGIAGIGRLQVGTTFSSMYRSDHPFIDTIRWLEEEIGAIVPVEIILTFEPSEERSVLQEIYSVDRLAKSLKELPGVDGATSMVDFLPPIPQGKNLSATAKRAVFSKMLAENLSHLQESPLFRIDEGEHKWRVIARVSAFSESFKDTLHSVQETVRKHTDDPENSFSWESYSVTGVMQLAYVSQDIMGSDFLISLGGAMCLLTLLMMWHAQSVRMGLVYMLPNLLPVALTLGGMAWLRIPIDMGGVLCSSVALGVAVDDTLHLTSYYQREKVKGESSFLATVNAVQACGPAMAITTATTCLSFIPFGMADFMPMRQFAWVCMVMLVLAWIGDMLILTPVLSRARSNTSPSEA